jgi:hypothetical protein
MRVVGGCLRIGSSSDRGPTLTNISIPLPRARLAAADSHANTYNGHLQFSHALFLVSSLSTFLPRCLRPLLKWNQPSENFRFAFLGVVGPSEVVIIELSFTKSQWTGASVCLLLGANSLCLGLTTSVNRITALRIGTHCKSTDRQMAWSERWIFYFIFNNGLR